MDVVYILGSGSKWKNNEIRYSLRSVEQYMEGYRNVFIIGERPGFLDVTKFTHIYLDDRPKAKALNAMRKIKTACLDKRVSENFILMNDDFFLLKPYKPQNYNRGTLEKYIAEHMSKEGDYYKACMETKEWLEQQGIKSPLNYGLHVPIIINKKKAVEVIDKMYPVKNKLLLFRTVYGNLCGIESKERKDIKIYVTSLFKEPAKNQDILSTDDRICQSYEFQSWIKQKFPNKSKYEKRDSVVG